MLIVTSTSLLTDRMLAYSGALDDLEAVVWASSSGSLDDAWESSQFRVEPFPEIAPDPYWPVSVLSRLNDMVWETQTKTPSRVRPRRDGYLYFRNNLTRVLLPAAKPLGWTRQGVRVQQRVRTRVAAELVDSAICTRLGECGATAVFIMNPFSRLERVVAVSTQSLGLPVCALIPSWDNISTKQKMLLDYDHYFVWSHTAVGELDQYYPEIDLADVTVVGAPQFDVFWNPHFEEPKAVWCRRHGLHPDRATIVYAVGSPNFLDEVPGAVFVAEQLVGGAFGDAQMIVRPHPIHDRQELVGVFDRFGERVRVQSFDIATDHVIGRSQSSADVQDWVSTFRHADVVVNLCSTVSIDAAIAGTPVVNLAFDAAPGAPRAELIRAINQKWTHFAPVAASGGLWQAYDFEDLVAGIRTYLGYPARDAAKRLTMAESVIGPIDGRAGLRLNQALRAHCHPDH